MKVKLHHFTTKVVIPSHDTGKKSDSKTACDEAFGTIPIQLFCHLPLNIV